MINNKNIPYYIIVFVIFILLKYAYTLADNNQLLFLLKPVNLFVSASTSSFSVFIPEKGYFHRHLNILIDKSCSGLNFWLIGFLMFSFLGLKYSQNQQKKLVVIPLALIVAYLLTIFVNASRIFILIVIQKKMYYFTNSQLAFIHEAVGIITYLSFLILVYIIADKILINRVKHEKSIKP